MPQKESKLTFAGTACERLLGPQLAEMTAQGPPRVFIDNMGRPMLSRDREQAIRGLERFRWWNATEHFPEEPDEQKQTAALANWFLGLFLSSSMLMAPVLGALAALSFSDAEVGMGADVYTAVAIISLMLLVLLLARFARPLWGESDDPCLPLRRLFFLLLPVSVIAANWWLIYPAPLVKAIGVFAPLLLILLLIAMVVWFLALYFRYTERVHLHDYLLNQTPQSTIMAFYDLLSHVKTAGERERNLVRAVQYFAEFLESEKHEPGNAGDPPYWRWPSHERSLTLKEAGADLVKKIQVLTSGDQMLGLSITKLVFLRPIDEENEGNVIFFAGSLQYTVTRRLFVPSPEEAMGGRGEISGQLLIGHTLVAKPDGWYIENGPPVLLNQKDLAALREHGLLT